MRLVVFLSVFALVAGVSINAAGQVRTAEELAKTMRRIGPAQQAASKAIQAKAYVDASTQLQTMGTERVAISSTSSRPTAVHG